MIKKKPINCICGGYYSKLVKAINRGIILLFSVIIVSCHGNDIFVDKENKAIYSNHDIYILYVETNNELYIIESKDATKADKIIKLDSIPNSYKVTKNSKGIAISDSSSVWGFFNILRKNESYEISNCSNGDAAAARVSFDTDSNGNIK